MRRILSILTLVLLSSCTLPTESVEVEPLAFAQTLPFRNGLQIETIIGAVNIVPGSGDSVLIEVVGAGDPDLFSTECNDTGSSLSIRELIADTRNTSGWWSRWTITLPHAAGLVIASGSGSISLDRIPASAVCTSGSGSITLTRVDGSFHCTSGSGGVTIDSSSGTFNGGSGSGRIEVTSSTGWFALESGSGGITADASIGDFSLTSGSGSITVDGLVLWTAGSFTTGSGDVAVGLPAGEGYDLALSSGSGDAALDLNGADPAGTFALTCLLTTGRIVCPWTVNSSEIITMSGQEYRRKTYLRGTGGLAVSIGTGSGTARIDP